MLWREPYATRTVDADWPELACLQPDGAPVAIAGCWALIGSFRARAHQQREVWRRLFESELPLPYRLVLVGHAPTSPETRLWLGSLPPSLQTLALVLPDLDRAWTQIIAPEHEDQAFAMLLNEKRPDLVMVGPPTEEAWEAFLQRGSSASK